MKVVRSWPLDPPDDHPLIIDNSERVFIPTVDYRPLDELGEDFIHLDWDMAVSREALREFAKRCLETPETVRIVPYKSYPTRRRRDEWRNRSTGWVAWHIDYEQDQNLIRIKTGEPMCDAFGFGMVYIPYRTFRDYANQETGECTDVGFGRWHHRKFGKDVVPIEWDIPVIHLNYSFRDALEGPD